MKQATALLLSLLMLHSVAHAAGDIILHLRPETSAPIVTRMIATEKVLMDAAPATADKNWQKLELKLPFEGYVPEAALSKNFAIIENTPVHFLPDAGSDTLTRAKDGDRYEIKKVKEGWATVRFNKKIPVYFQTGAAPSPAPAPAEISIPEPPPLDLTPTAPSHTPRSDAINFDPSLDVAQTSIENLPPENVVWQSAPRSTATVEKRQSNTAEIQPASPKLPNGIMVGPEQTQARENVGKAAPVDDKPIRLLVGKLVRKINNGNPAYPVRLLSDEGRLIAFVDFSGYFVEDLSPYLDERVYLRGHLAPLDSGSQDLVILVRGMQIAP